MAPGPIREYSDNCLMAEVCPDLPVVRPEVILGTVPLSARQAFIREVSQPDEDISLAAASLRYAAEEYPGLDIVLYLGRIALLSQRVKASLPGPGRHGTYDAIHAINTVLFEEEGFRGDTEAYYDPRNSFLNEVIDRKLGIPITLSVLYIEVARKAGHRFRSIGMPSHFLLAAGQGTSEIFVDPFNRGGLLSKKECVAMALRGKEIPREGFAILGRRLLPVLDKKATLRRMQNNLKQTYMQSRDYMRALRACERAGVLEPDDWRNLSDLARVLTELGRFSEAVDSLTAFIERAPAGSDLKLAENALRQLRELAAGSTPHRPDNPS
ncbi:MAG: tetratricopeptide repeat protein [Dehalococcoidia bacterium]|nr:tetratricopeptide repeat protein [Dehalococcoidia bacterium]